MKKKMLLLLSVLAAIAFAVGVMLFIANKEAKETMFQLRKNNWAQVTDDIWVFGGEVSENMTLIISGKEATIIDTGSIPIDSDLKRSANQLKNMLVTKELKVKNIIYTHYDLDHVSNTSLFKGDEPEGSVSIYTPYNAKDGQLIKMGDKSFRIIRTYGHAAARGGHMSIELPEENILVSGDVLYTNFIPCMMEGDSPTAYIDTLEKIKKAEYSIIIPGHGNILKTDYTIKRPLEYLYTLKKKTEKMLKQGASLADLHRNIKLQDCFTDTQDFNLKDPIQAVFHRQNIEQVYKELKKINCIVKYKKEPSHL